MEKMAAPQEMTSSKMFGGFNRRYKHESSSLGCSMTFTIYFPPAADSDKVPVRFLFINFLKTLSKGFRFHEFYYPFSWQYCNLMDQCRVDTFEPGFWI